MDVVAANHVNCTQVYVEVDYSLVEIPTVTTQAATDIEATTARLNGQISDDGGEACQYMFRYKKGVGGEYSYTDWAGAKTTGQTFYEDIGELDPESLYYFNAQAKNSAGESDWGDELSFTTAEDWLSGWGYRMEITLDHTKVDADLDNFPVLVYLDSTYTDFWSHCNSEQNIAFTSSDRTTKLKREIEMFDHTNDKLYAHVKVLGLSSTVDTDIYIYYDSASHEQANDADTWDDNFKGVWHLSEDPSGTAPQMFDSTSNDYDGTSQGSMTSGDQVEGQIDGSLDLDGTDDYIDCGNGLTVTGPITVEAWGKIDANDSVTKLILTKYDGIGGIWFGRGGNNKWTFQLKDQDTVLHYIFSNEVSSPGTQTYLAGKWGGSVQKIYVGAVEQTDTASWSGSIGTNTNPLCIGSYIDQWYFEGALDEIRISNVARSAAWIKTTFNNQSDPASFYSVGGEETPEVGEEYERPVEQGFALAGLAPRGAEFGRAIEQNFSFGAAIMIVMEICKLLSQAFGVTGTVGVSSEWGKSLAQDFSLDGSVEGNREFSKSVAQDFSLTGEVSAGMERWGSIDQTFSVDGVVSRDLEARRNIVQPFSLGATVAGVSEFAVALAQSFSLIGAVGVDKEVSRGMAQDFSFTDSAEANRELDRNIAQDFSLTESITAGKGIAIDLSETFSLSATVAGPASFIRELSEELSFTATLETQYERSIDLSEDFSFDAAVDVAVQRAEIEINIAQDFALTGAVQASRESGIGITQTYSVSDAVMAGGEYGVSPTQEFSFTATVEGIPEFYEPQEYERQVSQEFSLSESVSMTKEVEQVISQEYSLTGVVAVYSEYTRTVSQSFSFADAVAVDVERVLREYSYALPQGFTLEPMLSISAELSRSVSQYLSFVDAVEGLRPTPEPISPIENQPYYMWTDVGADNYRLLVDNDIDFSSPCENRVLDVNYYQTPLENALENGVYYWKIISYFYGEGVESDVWSFSVGGVEAEPPFDWAAAAMFIFPIVLMVTALAFDNPVFASFAGVAFIISGVHFIDTIWLGLIFAGVGAYLLITAFMSEGE